MTTFFHLVLVGNRNLISIFLIMIYPKIYSTIFYRFMAGRRAIQLVFYNNKNKDALLFNGFVYSFIKNAEFNSSSFSRLEYAVEMNTKNEEIVIAGIKYDFDMSFIRLDNDDVFVLFFMMDDIASPQQLMIYDETSARYKWALGRFNETPEADIAEDTLIKNVEIWFEKHK